MKVNPKIIFEYSPVYDRQWSLSLNKKFDVESSKKRFGSFIDNFQKYLTKNKQIIFLQLIERYSGLKWKYDIIWVYFINNLNIAGFSVPLTVKISDDYLDVCSTLIHEAIHNILIQNDDKVKPVIEHLNQLFPNEDKKAILHIIVNSIERKVFSEVFGKNKYMLIFEKTRNYKGLKRAYEILEGIYPKLGNNILDSLIKMQRY